MSHIIRRKNVFVGMIHLSGCVMLFFITLYNVLHDIIVLHIVLLCQDAFTFSYNSLNIAEVTQSSFAKLSNE